jgi:phosphoglycerol transferase
MFGAGVKPKAVERPAAMFDVYPTILDAMGFDLPNDKAGLGVSLLGDHPTLLETMGMAVLDHSIRYDASFRNWLWDVDDAARDIASSVDPNTTGSVPLAAADLRSSD